jgi:hypothetical protein
MQRTSGAIWKIRTAAKLHAHKKSELFGNWTFSCPLKNKSNIQDIRPAVYSHSDLNHLHHGVQEFRVRL